ncbi:importin subunit alpha-1 [Tanacetum coccineum]
MTIFAILSWTNDLATSAFFLFISDMLSNDNNSIKKEACRTISGITYGNKDQIQAVIEANIIDPLVNLLQNSEFDIKKEASWAISNATSFGRYTQIK